MEGPREREAPAAALAAVLKHSLALPSESTQVRGYDFNRGVDYRALLEAFGTTGFQATNFGRAVQQVNAMVRPGAGLPVPMPDAEGREFLRQGCGSLVAGSNCWREVRSTGVGDYVLGRECCPAAAISLHRMGLGLVFRWGAGCRCQLKSTRLLTSSERVYS